MIIDDGATIPEEYHRRLEMIVNIFIYMEIINRLLKIIKENTLLVTYLLIRFDRNYLNKSSTKKRIFSRIEFLVIIKMQRHSDRNSYE